MDLKPALTIDEQIVLLKKRGMVFANENKAKNFLSENNYYRLNIYFHLKKIPNSEHFSANTTFEDIVEIYNADSKLRHGMMPALEKAEVTLRTRLAYYLAHHFSPSAFYNQSIYSKQQDYEMLQAAFEKETERNARDPRIVHHILNYEGIYPIWVIVEFLSFNTLSKYYNSLLPSVKKAVATEYYHLNEEYLSSWLHSVSVLRNICAHYGFLYRRKFTSRPRLGNYFNPWDRKNNSTIMAQLLVLRKLSNSTVIENMIQSFQNVFCANKAVTPGSYGLPNNWDLILRNIR